MLRAALCDPDQQIGVPRPAALGRAFAHQTGGPARRSARLKSYSGARPRKRTCTARARRVAFAAREDRFASRLRDATRPREPAWANGGAPARHRRDARSPSIGLLDGVELPRPSTIETSSLDDFHGRVEPPRNAGGGRRGQHPSRPVGTGAAAPCPPRRRARRVFVLCSRKSHAPRRRRRSATWTGGSARPGVPQQRRRVAAPASVRTAARQSFRAEFRARRPRGTASARSFRVVGHELLHHLRRVSSTANHFDWCRRAAGTAASRPHLLHPQARRVSSNHKPGKSRAAAPSSILMRNVACDPPGAVEGLELGRALGWIWSNGLLQDPASCTHTAVHGAAERDSPRAAASSVRPPRALGIGRRRRSSDGAPGSDFCRRATRIASCSAELFCGRAHRVGIPVVRFLPQRELNRL